jgi:hypothetical protein
LTHTLGINADGDITAHQHEVFPGEAPEEDHLVSDLRTINLALHHGRQRYPWLAALLPPRPADALTCSNCGGTGTLALPATCSCGGAGWVPASDTG